MKDSAERARQGNSLFIREQCDKLREETLLQVGDAVFGELAYRAIFEIQTKGELFHTDMTNSWGTFDHRREVHAKRFCNMLHSDFEALVRLVDMIPLHNHFAPLPGDECIEQPRLSMKRRMRKEQSDITEIDQSGEALPSREWQGFPQYELRSMLMGEGWPEDKELAELEPKQLKAFTPTIPSVRSPVHKSLVK